MAADNGKFVVTSLSPEETRELGRRIGRLCEPGDVIALDGELGAGKTCFVQGLAEGLDVPKGSYVRSPTFTLLNIHQGRVPLYHFDLYRITDPDELDNIGYSEYLHGNGISAVEWASNVEGSIPRECLKIIINRSGESERKIEIAAIGKGYEGRFSKEWL